MRASRIATFVQIRPGEGRMVVLIGALFALIDASRGFGPNAVDALFFRRFGVENLPYMFMGLGVANFLVTLVYTAGLSRFNRRHFFVGLLAVLTLILVVERATFLLDFAALWPVLWLTIRVIGAILGTFMWHLAGDVTDTRQAKRLFSLFTSASIGGSVVGNLLTGPLAKWLGTDNLLLVYAGVLMACIVLTRAITQAYFKPGEAVPQTAGFVENVRAGLDYVRGSSLFQLMAFASILFSVLFFSISFLFSEAVAANFPDEAAIAGFLGIFNSVATGVTLVVSLFLANRLYARIGLVNAVFTLPVTYLASFTLLFGVFTLPSAVIVRFSQQVLLSGLASTAWSTFYNVVPPDKRGPVRTFDFGVPAQVGTILSGVLLILGQTVLQRQQVFIIGFAMAALCSLLVWRMRQSYGEALVDALRAGRFEVFTADERTFAGYQGDAAAIQVALDALKDEKAGTRRLAIEVLGLMGARSAVHAVIEALDDPESEVRVAAAKTLVDVDLHGSAPALVSTLLDEQPDPAVLDVTLAALPRALDQATSTLVGRLEALQHAAAMPPTVRARAAAALLVLGEEPLGEPTLDALLADDKPSTRLAALRALGAAAGQVGERLARRMTSALDDPQPSVRRAACIALSRMTPEEATGPLAQALSDADPSVRQAAAEGLREFGPAASEQVLTVLNVDDPPTLSAALDALDPADPTTEEPLKSYAHDEIRRIETWRAQANALPSSENGLQSTRLLADLLEARIEAGAQRLVKALGLLRDPDTMALVGQGLQASDSDTRAAAIEALETLGDKELAGEVAPLLEDAPPTDDDPMTAERALRQLLDEGGWMQAVAARVAADLGLRSLTPELRAIEAGSKNKNLVAWEAARDALARLGETVQMETLQTISSLERVMLLREVPLFSGLAPEDLKSIADVAREELHSKGADIMREGEQGSQMYIIVSGEARILKDEGGHQKELARRGPGDFVGEMAVIESQPRFATVRAEGDVRVLVLDGDAFDAILRDRPEVGRALVRGLSRRLREIG